MEEGRKEGREECSLYGAKQHVKCYPDVEETEAQY